MTVTGFAVGDSAIYVCKVGYEDMSGPSVRSCDEDGEWSDSAPECTPIGTCTILRVYLRSYIGTLIISCNIVCIQIFHF